MAKNDIVKIDQGELQGAVLTTDDGFEYVSFMGIPYAKPPIGPLRFKDPQPADGWTGVRNATAEANVFIQTDFLVPSDPIGSEDALYINVNVLANTSADKKLPVMVWIYGGGFHAGSGNKIFYGPDNLVQRDVIVVTFNYRLGLLGFLSLNTPEVPGNAGLKDQVMALKWVRNNIEKFGGDKDNVVIFGESAGSASVCFLMISPMAEGLFNKAIMQSGTCFHDWILAKEPEESAFKFAERFGVMQGNKKELLRVLRAAPATELANLKGFSLSDKYTFAPVVEKSFDGVEAIFTELPHDIIAGKKFKAVPTILGFNSEEGILGIPPDKYQLEMPLTEEEVEAAFKSLIPQNLTKEKQNLAMDLLKKQYFSPDKHHMKSFIDMKSDTMFIKGTDDLAKHLAQRDQPVYFYNFGYHGQSNLYAPLVKYPYKGAAHADELSYIFKSQFDQIYAPIFKSNPELAPKIEPSKEDRLVTERMADMWTNFAKCGNPTPATNEILTTIWTPYTKNSSNCLEINEGIKMTVDTLKDRMQFWDDFPKKLQ